MSKLNRLKNFTGRFLCKFAVKWILRIPPQLAYVATLPFETSISAKQAINDKLQGSVATYLRCVFNNQIKKRFIAECVNFLKLCGYSAKLQAKAWLSHALCALGQHAAKRRR